MSAFEKVDLGLLSSIFEFLPFQDLLKCRLVCREFDRTAKLCWKQWHKQLKRRGPRKIVLTSHKNHLVLECKKGKTGACCKPSHYSLQEAVYKERGTYEDAVTVFGAKFRSKQQGKLKKLKKQEVIQRERIDRLNDMRIRCGNPVFLDDEIEKSMAKKSEHEHKRLRLEEMLKKTKGSIETVHRTKRAKKKARTSFLKELNKE